MNLHTDAEIRAASRRDQADAGIRDMTADIVAFHRGLTAGKLPQDLVKDLTKMFAAASLSACDDECDHDD